MLTFHDVDIMAFYVDIMKCQHICRHNEFIMLI